MEVFNSKASTFMGSGDRTHDALEEIKPEPENNVFGLIARVSCIKFYNGLPNRVTAVTNAGSPDSSQRSRFLADINKKERPFGKEIGKLFSYCMARLTRNEIHISPDHETLKS